MNLQKWAHPEPTEQTQVGLSERDGINQREDETKNWLRTESSSPERCR